MRLGYAGIVVAESVDHPPYGTVLGIDRKFGYRMCPVHHLKGLVTGWKRSDGLDPRMLEYKCKNGHAFYIVEVNRDMR